MNTLRIANRSLAGMAILVVLGQPHLRGEPSSKTNSVPDSICAKVQALFLRCYPKAAFTNLQANGILIEYEVGTFEFPPADPTKKHENTVQRGPKKGGVLCSIQVEKGEYQGQLLLAPRGGRQYEPIVIDRKEYKQLLMAPYSARRDVHLWVSLSYPSDARDEFLKEFRGLMEEFENDAD